jgi:hypothetical protein
LRKLEEGAEHMKPRGCQTSAHVACRCDGCGRLIDGAVHMPAQGGFYDETCCPCRGPSTTSQLPEATITTMTTHHSLPAACSSCAPHGGAWAFAPGGGMRRCQCERGRALAELDARHEHSARWRDRPRRKSVAIPRDRDYKSIAAGGDR